MLWVQLEVAKRTTGVQLIQDHEYKPERLRLKHLQCSLRVSADAGRLEILAYTGSCPQDIIKVRQPSSLVYRPRHGVLPRLCSQILMGFKSTNLVHK